jgi:hypothetical protein
MTLEDSIHTHRLRVLREAERLGNVSDACWPAGSCVANDPLFDL